MASHGIKDRVAIIGMGCTRFAEHWDMGVDELLLAATGEAFGSAGVTKEDVDAYWLGTAQSVDLIVPKDVVLTLPRAARANLKVSAVFAEPVSAPIRKGQEIGVLKITAPGMEPKESPLIAANDVPQAGFFARMRMKLRLLLHIGSD